MIILYTRLMYKWQWNSGVHVPMWILQISKKKKKYKYIFSTILNDNWWH